MKRAVFALGLTVFALLTSLSPPAAAGATVAVNITMAPLTRSFSPPPLGRRQGWLAISNRDWHSYSLRVEEDELFLYREDSGFGGIIIPSGSTITLALEKETYDLLGSNPDKLRVRVREGRTTTLSLEPIGYAGNTGLMGVVNDGDRVRNGTLFDSYAQTIVVPQPPIMVAPPPPPPVIIHRPPHRPLPPPVVIQRPQHRPPGFVQRPPFRPGRPDNRPGFGPGRPGHRPPPPPPPPPSRPHGGREDGWSIIFGFGKR